MLSFGPVSSRQKAIEILEDRARQRRDLVADCHVVTDVHTTFWVPPDMDSYYETLSKNERKNRRKYELRLLKKEFTTEVDVLKDPAKVEQEFESFAVQHALQWNEEGKTGHFGAWPRALEFNRALVRNIASQGRLRFIRIVANGQVVANQYVFAFGDAYWWELPSRIVGAQWERFSLGPTGIVTMIEAALKEGIVRVEGGLAHYDYKLRLGAKEYAVKTVRVIGQRPGSRLRARIFGALRSAVGVLYHKIWYRRVMPRLLRKFWRPQAMFWLRLDF